jgi:hypothetical protein
MEGLREPALNNRGACGKDKDERSEPAGVGHP